MTQQSYFRTGLLAAIVALGACTTAPDASRDAPQSFLPVSAMTPPMPRPTATVRPKPRPALITASIRPEPRPYDIAFNF